MTNAIPEKIIAEKPIALRRSLFGHGFLLQVTQEINMEEVKAYLCVGRPREPAESSGPRTPPPSSGRRACNRWKGCTWCSQSSLKDRIGKEPLQDYYQDYYIYIYIYRITIYIYIYIYI